MSSTCWAPHLARRRLRLESARETPRTFGMVWRVRSYLRQPLLRRSTSASIAPVGDHSCTAEDGNRLEHRRNPHTAAIAHAGPVAPRARVREPNDGEHNQALEPHQVVVEVGAGLEALGCRRAASSVYPMSPMLVGLGPRRGVSHLVEPVEYGSATHVVTPGQRHPTV